MEICMNCGHWTDVMGIQGQCACQLPNPALFINLNRGGSALASGELERHFVEQFERMVLIRSNYRRAESSRIRLGL